MEESRFTYIMLEGHAHRITKRVKSVLDAFVVSGDMLEASKESGVAKCKVEKIISNPLIKKWISQRVGFVAKSEDFTVDELTVFLINSIRGVEPGMERRSFGNRLKAAEQFSKLKDLGGSNDIGTIKFLLKNENGVTGPESSPSAGGDKQ